MWPFSKKCIQFLKKPKPAQNGVVQGGKVGTMPEKPTFDRVVVVVHHPPLCCIEGAVGPAQLQEGQKRTQGEPTGRGPD
jgi:hypothetical protein